VIAGHFGANLDIKHLADKTKKKNKNKKKTLNRKTKFCFIGLVLKIRYIKPCT
jgi:hypothetical protein